MWSNISRDEDSIADAQEDTEPDLAPPPGGPSYDLSTLTRTLASTSNDTKSSAEPFSVRNSRSDKDTLVQTAMSVIGGTMV